MTNKQLASGIIRKSVSISKGVNMYDDDDLSDDEREERRNNNASTGGGIVSLIVVIALCWWGYNHFFKSYDKAWWDGTEYQRVCVVHNPDDRGCYTMLVTVEDGRITSLELPNGKTAVISVNDCGKATLSGGPAGKGNRYCVIGEFGGGREWQVNER